MDADAYQREALKTLKDWGEPGQLSDLVYLALAINGEAGELANVVKKAWRDRKEIDKDWIVEELGDILWYVAVLARKLGVPLSEVMRKNIEKLRKRCGVKE